ncbi:MAG: hypothetical protein F6K63_12185 [Moorea sp. SIO1G6]|uniref:hypothetical protein n=1 Tax=Moorena sp. SIO1G6 TaxID=2607840 RepID=UPI0013C01A63|nr:hypothetical protein [Moorena sp. SIO1G6]NET65099.1 hypothetical protein [Moorena sp. SIO1G6]
MSSNLPRIIFVINSQEQSSLAFNENSEQLFNNKDVGIILYPLEDNSSSSDCYPGEDLVNKLQQQGLIQTGNILIKSPFNDDYALATDASQTFALAKHSIFTELCGYLGAKEVLVNEVKINNKTKKSLFKTKLEIDGVTKLVPADVNTEREEAEKIEIQVELRTKFAGSNPNFTAVNQLLTNTQLENDQYMKSLVGLRQMENLAQEQEVSLNLSRESNVNFKIGASLLAKFPSLLEVNGIAEYQSSIQNVTEYNFRYKVTF